jgi:hypothetical protein
MKAARFVGFAAVATTLLYACAAEPAPAPVPEAAPHGKPDAPVTLEVDSVDLGARRFEVRVTATPSVSVQSLRLQLLVPAGVSSEEEDRPLVFGATAAGAARTLTRHVWLTVPGADVVADVRVDAGQGTRNRAHLVRLGAPRPARAAMRTDTVVLPNGDRVEEVRP